MKQMLILIGLLMLGTVPAPGKAQTIDKAEIVRRDLPDVQTRGDVGTVQVHLTNGKTLQLSHTGLASDVKIAPDHKTVAWVEGQIIDYAYIEPQEKHLPHPRTTMYFPARLIVWRNGKRVSRIVPKKLFTVQWDFVNGGKDIAVGSTGSHGMTYFQLFDTARGRKLAYVRSSEEKRPTWTRGLGSY
jgi:hypothetical protein